MGSDDGRNDFTLIDRQQFDFEQSNGLMKVS